MQFVVLSSSNGTTFQAILDAIKDGSLGAECLGLITDHEDRGCGERARAAGIPVEIVEKEKGEDRETYDRRLKEAILFLKKDSKVVKDSRDSKERVVSFESFGSFESSKSLVIALMGWMHILSPWFVRQYPKQILNVHPSLLPKYPGLNTHKKVLDMREKETGMTIHWVDEGLDTGPIIVQKKCPVFSSDNEAILKSRVQELEKEWYPKVLQEIHQKSIVNIG